MFWGFVLVATWGSVSGKHSSYPLFRSHEYYTSPEACQLPLDWFWFSGGYKMNMYEMKPFVPKRCPNLIEEDVDKDIRDKIKLNTDLVNSMELRGRVYTALDHLGITYNNCTKPVNTSDFPEELRIFLCTERVRRKLQEERERERCMEFWWEGEPLDSLSLENCSQFAYELLDPDREEAEGGHNTPSDSMMIGTAAAIICIFAIAIMASVLIHKCSHKSVVVQQSCLLSPAPRAVVSHHGQFVEDVAIDGGASTSEEDLPVINKGDVQTEEQAPVMEQEMQIDEELSGTEEDMQIEENTVIHGSAIAQEEAHARRNRLPGRTRQREARRRKQRTPSPP